MSLGVATISSLHLLAQLNLSDAFSDVGGIRFITGSTMLLHMFWAEIFVGFALAAPVLQAWGARTGSPRMDRLAHSMARFNILTFSTGATFAVLFVVLLVGLYPQVTTSLFTHFFYAIALAMLSMGLALWGMYSYYYKWDRYSVLNKKRHIALGFTMGLFIWVWMVIMTGIDTYMVTGGPGVKPLSTSTVESFGTAVRGVFNPMFTEMVLHRTFANLSWPAFALAAWASFMYVRSKTSEDRSFYDWSSSVGLTWGVGFLMLQPLVGFTIVYALKLSQPENPVIPRRRRRLLRAAHLGGHLEPAPDKPHSGRGLDRALQRGHVLRGREASRPGRPRAHPVFRSRGRGGRTVRDLAARGVPFPVHALHSASGHGPRHAGSLHHVPAGQAPFQVRQPGEELPDSAHGDRGGRGRDRAQHGVHEVQFEGAFHGI